MPQIPATDSSDFADLMDFFATSGRVRQGALAGDEGDRWAKAMWADRARAMSMAMAAVGAAAQSSAQG